MSQPHNYDDAREVINRMADVKMAMNRHKGRIEDVDVGQLLELMENEHTELYEAITDNRGMLAVIEEAADIQNFLLALVQKQLDKYRNRK